MEIKKRGIRVVDNIVFTTKVIGISRFGGEEPDFIFDSLGKIDGLTIYDIGCSSFKLSDKFIGVDIEQTEGVDICANADSLPMIKDSTADFIISRHSFEHFLNPCKVLKEWKRILKITGKIIFILPDEEKFDTVLLAPGEHLHAYTKESFKDLIENDGTLRVEKIETIIDGWSFGAIVSFKK